MAEVDSGAPKKRNRAVSDLTEEQIQQKRRIDRQAQRAFRQRTRDRISDLERHTVELQESFIRKEAQLQRDLQALRTHNRELVRRLASIAEISINPASPHSDDAASHNHLGSWSLILRNIRAS
jgi:hypothetical protein